MGEVVDEEFGLCPQSDIFPCLGEALYESAAKLQHRAGFRRGGINDFVGIVGAGFSTPQQICHNCEAWPDGSEDGDLVESAFPGLDITPHRLRNTNGDSTVPVFSAIQGDDPDNPPGYNVDFHFTCGIGHLGLMSDPDVLSRTVPYLTGDAELPSSDEVFSETPCDVPDEAE